MTLVEGENGQGKSNLLEAVYMLAIAKSQRAAADRDLVRKQAIHEEAFAQIAADVHRARDKVRVQIDFKVTPAAADAEDVGPWDEPVTVQKYVRVNGAPRRATDLVGEVNAVLFTAQDLDMVYGSPSARRRYLDILISQVDRQYLRALQNYQRVLTQRNHLLKRIRERRSKPGELEFWDGELVTSGAAVLFRRVETLERLSETAVPIHAELAGKDEEIKLSYRPSFELAAGATAKAVGEMMHRELEAVRSREIAQGFSVRGPHRDDFQLLLNGGDVAQYASRGQCRTAVLSLKLAEAAYLRNTRQEEPVILLDDVLSELDARRRSLVLERASQYQQSIVTTADAGLVEAKYLEGMQRYVVREGRVESI